MSVENPSESESPTVLLLSCPDTRGIVAAVADAILTIGGNIVHAEQHSDADEGVFFQRVEVDTAAGGSDSAALAAAMAPVVERFGMDCRIEHPGHRPRVAILASRQPHCLYDLLTRWRTGELPVDLRLVICNHPDHAEVCAWAGVPFHHLPVTPATKPEQEAAILALLQQDEIELVVLARYMQILSGSFVERYPHRIINIHHSFLPAFAGARPYHQAHERGVKVIGVSAHYATADLDEGPIIEQDVTRVSHRDDVADLQRKGRDLETVVLARAVKAHIEHRVLVYGRKTVVFS